jgi:transposase
METNNLAGHQKKARITKSSIVFIDESGFLMSPLVRRTWAPTGKTPVLLQRGRSHKKVSAIAAIVVSPHARKANLYFRLHINTSIYAHLVTAFLRQLSSQISEKFIIVWDRLNTHRARKVSQWIVSRKHVSQVYFPPYAPELNPVEYVWGNVKTNPLANLPETDVEDLAYTAYRFTRKLQFNHTILKSFLKHSSLF